MSYPNYHLLDSNEAQISVQEALRLRVAHNYIHCLSNAVVHRICIGDVHSEQVIKIYDCIAEASN